MLTGCNIGCKCRLHLENGIKSHINEQSLEILHGRNVCTVVVQLA